MPINRMVSRPAGDCGSGVGTGTGVGPSGAGVSVAPAAAKGGGCWSKSRITGPAATAGGVSVGVGARGDASAVGAAAGATVAGGGDRSIVLNVRTPLNPATRPPTTKVAQPATSSHFILAYLMQPTGQTWSGSCEQLALRRRHCA